MDALRSRLAKLEFKQQESVDSTDAAVSASPSGTPQALGATAGRWRDAADKSRTMEDPWAQRNIEDKCPEERAKRHRFNPVMRKWTVDDILVKMEKEPFAHGAMRNCFRMKKLSKFTHEDWQHASNYVAKSYIKRQPKDSYFDDVQLQMDAKLWGNEFNKSNPPKKVDIIQTYIIEMVDRKDKPIYCVEHLIEGNYIKYNSNSGFVSDTHRRTPQAFSHFTFEHSSHQLIVVDVQGVGDLYTDPQIHTAAGSDYGEANLGVKGMALFFATHQCNPLCRQLGLQPFELSAHELATAESLKTLAMDTLTTCPTKRIMEMRDAPNTRQKLIAEADHRLLTAVRCLEALPASVQRVVTADDFARAGAYDGTTESPDSPPPTAQLCADSNHIVSSRSTRNDQPLCSLQEKTYRNKYDILGQVHMEFAVYHEIGRFSPEPNVLDALFHVDCAARCGHHEALKTIAQIYLQLLHDILPGVTAEPTAAHHHQGLRYLHQSAECGDRDAMVILARRLDTGDGLLPPEQAESRDELDKKLSTRSWPAAVEWYSRAACLDAAQENPELVPTVGPDNNISIIARQAEMYREGGHGLAVDKQKSSQLYESAAEAASEALKGKLAAKYYMLYEEVLYE